MVSIWLWSFNISIIYIVYLIQKTPLKFKEAKLCYLWNTRPFQTLKVLLYPFSTEISYTKQWYLKKFDLILKNHLQELCFHTMRKNTCNDKQFSPLKFSINYEELDNYQLNVNRSLMPSVLLSYCFISLQKQTEKHKSSVCQVVGMC